MFKTLRSLEMFFADGLFLSSFWSLNIVIIVFTFEDRNEKFSFLIKMRRVLSDQPQLQSTRTSLVNS